MDQHVRSCTNCGTEWNDEIGSLQRAREFCPVCHLRLTGSSDTTPSNDDFTSQLRRLIEDAGFKPQRRYQDYTPVVEGEEGCPCCRWREAPAAAKVQEGRGD